MRTRTPSPEHDLVAMCFAVAVAAVLLDLILTTIRF